MAHTKVDVVSTRHDLLRILTKQRDIYAGYIAALDNLKRATLMMSEDENKTEPQERIDAMVEKMKATP